MPRSAGGRSCLISVCLSVCFRAIATGRKSLGLAVHIFLRCPLLDNPRLLRLATMAGALALCFLAGLCAVASGRLQKPNILLIVSDDLGFGEVSAMPRFNGTQTPTIKTPNIDELFASGMRFDYMYTGQAVCAPSRYSLMTGYHREGLGHWLSGRAGMGHHSPRPFDCSSHCRRARLHPRQLPRQRARPPDAGAGFYAARVAAAEWLHDEACRKVGYGLERHDRGSVAEGIRLVLWPDRPEPMP